MSTGATLTVKRTIKFSWRGLVIAPLAVPVLFAGLETVSSPGANPHFTFAFFFVLSVVVSYGTMIFLFLPCLCVVSRFTALTLLVTGLIGIVLGALVYLPVLYETYLTSGDNSGSPQIGFLNTCGCMGSGWILLPSWRRG